MKHLLVVAALLVGSCRVVTRPPFREDEVWAYDQLTARTLADLVSVRAPQISTLLESHRETPEVWALDREKLDARFAATTSKRIWIMRGALPWADEAISHELAHWYRFSEDRLPFVLEEGIAVWVGARVRGRPLSVTVTGNWSLLLAMDRNHFKEFTDESKLEIYGLGYWLVDALGLDCLRALCERAKAEHLKQVPPKWIEDAFERTAVTRSSN